jgi:hypothetical protein
MGSGAPVKHDKLNIGTITILYAHIGNVRDALDKVEKGIEDLLDNPNDPELWKELQENVDRFKLRSQGGAYDMIGFIRSQNRG